MAVTFKDLLEEVYQVLPSTGEKGIAPIAVYDALNSAIDELSAESGIKNLMPERTEYIEIDVNDEYSLSGLDYQHIKTEHIRNEKGNRCDRKSRELLKTISTAGEKKYAQESEVIIVKPLVTSFTSTEMVFHATTNKINEDSVPNGFSFVTKGFVVGQKFYVSGSADNDGILTLSAVDTQELTVEEDLVEEAKGNTVTMGLAYEIVYRHALPTFTSFAGTSEIDIDEYFVPAIVHLAIANTAQAKDYGIETAISDRYFAIYEQDIKGLINIMSKKKQKQL